MGAVAVGREPNNQSFILVKLMWRQFSQQYVSENAFTVAQSVDRKPSCFSFS